MMRLLLLLVLGLSCTLAAAPLRWQLIEEDVTVLRHLGRTSAVSWLCQGGEPARHRLTNEWLSRQAIRQLGLPGWQRLLEQGARRGVPSNYRLIRSICLVAGANETQFQQWINRTEPLPEAYWREAARPGPLLDSFLTQWLGLSREAEQMEQAIALFLQPEQVNARLAIFSEWPVPATPQDRFLWLEQQQGWSTRFDAAARWLRVRAPAQMPFQEFTRVLAAVIDADPLLSREGVQRLGAARLVSVEVGGFLADTLPEMGAGLLQTYHLGFQANLPRFRATWEELCLEAKFFASELPRLDGQNELLRLWAERLRRDQAWRSNLLWLVSRPASVMGEAWLNALRASLQTNAELVKSISAATDGAPPDVWKEMDADDGRLTQWRRQRAKGATRDQELSFGDWLGTELIRDPTPLAWLMGDAPDLVTWQNLAQTQIFLGNPAVAQVWLSGLDQVDPSLRQGFLTWLVAQSLAGSEREADQMLRSLTAQVATSGPVGQDFGRFREQFARYAQSEEGRRLLVRRIRYETWGGREVVRNILAAAWKRNPKGYWQWRSRLDLLPGQAAAVFRLGTSEILERESFPVLLTELFLAQVPGALEPLEKGLDQLFIMEGDPVVKRVVSAAQFDPVLGPGFGIAVAAAVDALGRDLSVSTAWMESLAVAKDYRGEGGVAKLQLALNQSGQENRPILLALLQNEQFYLRWRRSLYNLLFYGGRQREMMALLQQDSVVYRLLQKAVVSQLGQDSYLLSRTVEMIQSSPAAYPWRNRLLRFVESLQEADANNSVFWEQFLVSPDLGWSKRWEAKEIRQ